MQSLAGLPRDYQKYESALKYSAQLGHLGAIESTNNDVPRATGPTSLSQSDAPLSAEVLPFRALIRSKSGRARARPESLIQRGPGAQLFELTVVILQFRSGLCRANLGDGGEPKSCLQRARLLVLVRRRQCRACLRPRRSCPISVSRGARPLSDPSRGVHFCAHLLSIYPSIVINYFITITSTRDFSNQLEEMPFSDGILVA